VVARKGGEQTSNEVVVSEKEMDDVEWKGE
jgi:hypothetical protein